MDSYRIVTTNPDSQKIKFVPYDTNPGFVSYRGSQILTFLKDSFWIISHESSQFSKIRLFLGILRILSTIARNESLKIEIRESESLRILKIWIRESGFVNPNLKDSYRGFVLWIRFWNIHFVDSFRANKNLELLDSFRFVRIRIRIPHLSNHTKATSTISSEEL